ncbi:MAG: coproporphyrinogen dehydrogenase HemZ [Christensenellales bacterium]
MTIAFDTPTPEFIKEAVELAAAFFPLLRLVGAGEDPDLLVTHRERLAGELRRCSLTLSGSCQGSAEQSAPVQTDPLLEKRLHKRQVKLALYAALAGATGIQPPWGSLTGIRPARMVQDLMAQGLTLQDALNELRVVFDVKPDRLALLEQVVLAQRSLPAAGPDAVDLYIGIPFCPSRCRYCSFISQEVGDGRHLAPYVDALQREIEAAGRLIQEAGLRVRAFYMGGGTPTALPAPLLARVLDAMQPLYRGALERTVEAGRPDSIDREKLTILKDHGIGRISINPQTLHDSTLALIGRAHTARQTETAFRLARDLGFRNINMDVIAGLPAETPAMFGATLRWLRGLQPDSLTLHCLAIKRSSDTHRWQDSLPPGETVKIMMDEGLAAAREMGLIPYYLYRQKHMAGNLENIGFSRPGLQCLYNVDTMEDSVSVLALGAGAISKRVTPGRVLVTRSPNVKQIDQYIDRVADMAARKRLLFLQAAQPDILAQELEPLANPVIHQA